MSDLAEAKRVRTLEELEALYGEPPIGAVAKEIDHISAHYRSFIEKSPFVVVATCGPDGLDCSPRGDPSGFVRVADPKTVLIPDRRGNNRLDSLRNLIRDPRISLLFLIPGVGETLRIHGRAEILDDRELRGTFEMAGKTPTIVIAVKVEHVYFHCAKALIRSRLWDSEAQIPRSTLPSAGQMLERLTGGEHTADELDRNYQERLKKNLY